MAPIVFSKGAIGNSDILEVSPEHRMLVSDSRTEMLFGQEQVLISAKHMLDGDQVYRRIGGDVTYYHFMFDQHEIVFSRVMPESW